MRFGRNDCKVCASLAGRDSVGMLMTGRMFVNKQCALIKRESLLISSPNMIDGGQSTDTPWFPTWFEGIACTKPTASRLFIPDLFREEIPPSRE